MKKISRTVAGVIDGDGVVTCPVCGDLCQHIGITEDDQEFAQKINQKFGSIPRVWFWGECGCRWIMSFRHEKGFTSGVAMILTSCQEEGLDYHEYIRSPEWRERAEAAKERAGQRCQVCNKHRDEITLDAHHRTYERLGEEHPYDITVLCRYCHELFETTKKSKTASKPILSSRFQPRTRAA